MGRSFANRVVAMRARWDRMAKDFTRVGREITIAVRQAGPDPDANPALRRAIQNGRACNMPKDRIEAAIKRASGADAENYDTVIYEGYGPHGVAVVVETATNNPTRTVANVRVAFNKNGGNLGTSGSVTYLFNKMGVLCVARDAVDIDELELALIDHGLEDVDEDEDDHGRPIYALMGAFNRFGDMQSALEEMGIETLSAAIEYIPTMPMTLSESQAQDIGQLVDQLERDDDVQHVFVNVD